MLTSLRPGRGFFLNTEASPPGCSLELFVCLFPTLCGACPHFRGGEAGGEMGGEEGDFKKNPTCPTAAGARGPRGGRLSKAVSI